MLKANAKSATKREEQKMTMEVAKSTFDVPFTLRSQASTHGKRSNEALGLKEKIAFVLLG